MEIIIDVGNNSADSAENESGFVVKFCAAWLDLFQDDEIFILGNFQPGEKITTNRLSVLDPGANSGNLLSELYFYEFRLPELAKKFPNACFLSFSGQGSLKLKIPQILFSGFGSMEVTGTKPPGFIKCWHRSRYRKLAAKLVCFVFGSGFLKELAEIRIPQLKGKTILFFQPHPDQLSEISEFQKEAIRAEKTDGKEYFLWECREVSAELLTSVLKGFSAFKKRQQTNMQIILTGMDFLQKELSDLLTGYKYRSDLHVTGKLSESELLLIRGSAYAVLHPAVCADTEAGMMLAMCSRVPVLCADLPLLKNLAGNSALYFDPRNPDDINRQMSYIFKNENERSELVTSGFKKAMENSLPSMIQSTREILLKLQRGAGIP